MYIQVKPGMRLHIALLIISGVLLSVSSARELNVGDRVLARWTNNLYYTGKIGYLADGITKILFDDGDRITHSTQDISAVLQDEIPDEVGIGNHILATWTGGHKYFIGYVTGVDSERGCMLLRFDDNIVNCYPKTNLREFLDHSSPHEVGARVFARWTNGLYYRGFVMNTTDSTVFINYDDGDTITLYKIDVTAVILDKPPHFTEIQAGQRVIGYWPARTRYYPGVVLNSNDFSYDVRFDDGDRSQERIFEIRLIPGCEAQTVEN